MVTAAVAGLIVLMAGGVLLVGYFLKPRKEPVREQGPASGWEYVFVGAIFSAVGGVMLALGDPFLYVAVPLVWIGGVVVAAGVIAIGVTVGSERAEYRRRR
jgi:uncharacterized membrane protein HdeD (DUF308 family)